MNHRMDILLTGSSGYIGTRLADRFNEQGAVVHGVDREPYEGDSLSSVVTGDLLDGSTLDRMNDDVDCICHLAAAKGDWGISKDEYYRDNLEVTRNVIEAGVEAGVEDWIFYSTVSTLGPHHEPVDEDADFNAINPYGASKAEAEKLFHQLAEENSEARILIIRPSVVYGPGNPPSTNIYRLVDAIYNRRFAMVGPGDAIKSTSYIENLLEATLFLMERMERGIQTYHLRRRACAYDRGAGRAHLQATWKITAVVAHPVKYRLADCDGVRLGRGPHRDRLSDHRRPDRKVQPFDKL